jgi:hypothetical protein
VSNLPQVSRPIRDSILDASTAVRAAAQHPRMALESVRDASTALEFHLDTLTKEIARATVEPRLLSRASALERRLREALVETWSLERDLRTGYVDTSRMHHVAYLLREAAEDEIDLLFEEVRGAGELD